MDGVDVLEGLVFDGVGEVALPLLFEGVLGFVVDGVVSTVAVVHIDLEHLLLAEHLGLAETSQHLLGKLSLA